MMTQVSQRNNVALSTILLALGAETALFGTLVMSYLYFRTGGSTSPFTHFEPLDLVIASVNTLVLLASAAFAWRSRRAIADDRVRRMRTSLLITFALGVVFIIGQIIEFNHSGIKISDTVFGAAIFALISFHALHVIAGMIILGLNWARARLGDFSARRHVAITVGTWFWYYVTAVWVVLFSVMYLV